MIAVVGGYGQGLTMRLARSPLPGETVGGGVLSSDHGGKGSNQAVAARRLGVDALIVTAIGDDTAGAAARELWAAEGVTDHAVQVPGVGTMTGFILVEPSGENRICIADGALASLSPEHLDAPLALIGPGDIVLVSLEIPFAAAWHALDVARERGALTIVNPAPVIPGARELLTRADIVTPNRGELGALAGVAAPETIDEVRLGCSALREITGYTGALVVTLGADGVFVDDGDHTIVPPTRVTKVVDTTGAGDAFSAAFAVAIHEGATIREAARFATAAAAFTVTREQVIPSLPYRADVDRLTETGAHRR